MCLGFASARNKSCIFHSFLCPWTGFYCVSNLIITFFGGRMHITISDSLGQVNRFSYLVVHHSQRGFIYFMLSCWKGFSGALCLFYLTLYKVYLFVVFSLLCDKKLRFLLTITFCLGGQRQYAVCRGTVYLYFQTFPECSISLQTLGEPAYQFALQSLFNKKWPF